VTSEGNLEVRQLSLGRMVKDGSLPVPDFIKIDVEGGEKEVLSNNFLCQARNARCNPWKRVQGFYRKLP